MRQAVVLRVRDQQDDHPVEAGEALVDADFYHFGGRRWGQCFAETLSKEVDRGSGNLSADATRIVHGQRRQESQPVVVWVSDSHLDRQVRGGQQTLEGRCDMRDLMIVANCLIAVQLDAHVRDQGCLVWKVPIHGHLRTTGELGNPADGDTFVALLRKQAAGGLDNAPFEFGAGLEFVLLLKLP